MIRRLRAVSALIATTSLAVWSVAQGPSSRQAAPPANLPKSEGPLGPILDALAPRQLGPTNMAGRMSDFAVYEKEPRIYYAASASGGLWKTVNNGITFDCVFDKEGSISLGAVAISPKNPDIVYVGTGEQSSRNSVAWGDGVYKSIDGGKTWKHLGLKETMHISRIVVHPNDPNTVYVGALGKLWGKNDERGVYKSTDGGQTWSKVLFIANDTGIIDLDIDPKNPKVLYASAWERLRKPFVFRSGGPACGIYKSEDGGKSWRKLGNGLPPAPLGRIGLSLYRKDPRIMLACVEFRPTAEQLAPAEAPKPAANAAPATATTNPQTGRPTGNQADAPRTPRNAPQSRLKDPRFEVPAGSQFNGGGLFLSKDGGETWEFLKLLNPRPFYFSTPLIDPNDWRIMYMIGYNMHRSIDGGKTWNVIQASVHVDHHAFWVNPKDSQHLMSGNDGGIAVSHDFGAKWRAINNFPIGQFYAVDFDMQRPYWVYGGLQDNGSWAFPTQTVRGGPGFWDAESLWGGDGFYVVADKTDARYIYAESQGGAAGRIDRLTGQRRSFGFRQIDRTLRFNWNTPLLQSPHEPATIYAGGNRLLKSTNRGDTWEAISPDLTTMSPRKLATALISRRTSINEESTGAENHCTIVTISESPRKKGLLAVGSDDGLVHISTDGGQAWADVTPNIPDLPAGLWCSRVLLSKWSDTRLYVTFDGHRSDDFNAYVYVSEDLGRTFKKLNAGLPWGDSVYVVREGEHNPNLLFLGSEMSLRVSVDRGLTWSRLRGSFPTVAVHDLKVHPEARDLVIGTHGRSIWTIDISALEELTPERANADIAVFTPQPVLRMLYVPGTSFDGDQDYVSRNTQPGTRIYFHLKSEPKSEPEIKVYSADGADSTVITGLKKAGLQSVAFRGRVGGVLAPGKYKVELIVDGKKSETTVTVQDPTPKLY